MNWFDVGYGLLLVVILVCVCAVLFLIPYVAIRLGLGGTLATAETKRLVLDGLTGGIPLGFTGLICGYLTGTSRTPAVGAVIPAALTLIGLLVVYLIGKDSHKALSAGMAVFLFSANLVVGSYIGSAARERHDAQANSIEAREDSAKAEMAVQMFRSRLGLPPETAKPLAPAQPANQ